MAASEAGQGAALATVRGWGWGSDKVAAAPCSLLLDTQYWPCHLASQSQHLWTGELSSVSGQSVGLY